MNCDYCKAEAIDGRFCKGHKTYICEEHAKLFNPSNDIIVGKKCDFCILQKIIDKRKQKGLI